MTLTLADVDLSNLDTFVERVPHDQFELLRREAPVFWHPATDHVPGVLVRHQARRHPRDQRGLGRLLERARRHHDLRAEPPNSSSSSGMMMLTMDPPKHTKLRLLVNKGFTPRMIGQLDQHIRDVAREIVDRVAERGECDFVVDIAAELPLQVIAEMMGVPHEDRHKLFEWSNRMIGSEDPEYAVTDAEAMEAATEMFMYANELAAEKRAEPERRHHQRAAAGRGRGRAAHRPRVRPVLRAARRRRQRDDAQPDLARHALHVRDTRTCGSSSSPTGR